MESLYPKGVVIDRLRKYISGVQFEDPQVTEEEKLLQTLDSLTRLETITEYLERQRGSYISLFRSFIEYSNRVEKQNKLETE